MLTGDRIRRTDGRKGRRGQADREREREEGQETKKYAWRMERRRRRYLKDQTEKCESGGQSG